PQSGSRRSVGGGHEGIRRCGHQKDAQLMSTDPSRKSNRRMYTTGSRGEFQFGFSRAVRHGTVVRVAGTAGIGPDGNVVSDDVVEQMRAAINRMKGALEDLGCTLGDVIMTRVYVQNRADITNVAVVHGEVFRDLRPAMTIVKVDFKIG